MVPAARTRRPPSLLLAYPPPFQPTVRGTGPLAPPVRHPSPSDSGPVGSLSCSIHHSSSVGPHTPLPPNFDSSLPAPQITHGYCSLSLSLLPCRSILPVLAISP